MRLVSGRTRSRNFNSRPCERGDQCRLPTKRCGLPISIHAPARGATITTRKEYKGDVFQFTPLREGRHAHRSVSGVIGPGISIHAPARGATNDDTLNHIASLEFQFTPLREGRQDTRRKK